MYTVKESHLRIVEALVRTDKNLFYIVDILKDGEAHDTEVWTSREYESTFIELWEGDTCIKTEKLIDKINNDFGIFVTVDGVLKFLTIKKNSEFVSNESWDIFHACAPVILSKLFKATIVFLGRQGWAIDKPEFKELPSGVEFETVKSLFE